MVALGMFKSNLTPKIECTSQHIRPELLAADVSIGMGDAVLWARPPIATRRASTTVHWVPNILRVAVSNKGHLQSILPNISMAQSQLQSKGKQA